MLARTFRRVSDHDLFRSLAVAMVATLLTAAATPACSSNEATDLAPSCDDSRCAPGNKCLPLNGETKCRKVCSSNSEPSTSCPFGYTCIAPEAGGEAFCQQDQALNDDGSFVTKSAKGQWGAPCNPTGGIENPDCDADQGFYCYGTSPADANAYCTRFDCETDRNCGAGFGCETVNTTPNVNRQQRTRLADAKADGTGEVHNVCLRREYCSTCRVDLDCPPVDGVPQHCVDDLDGKRFCAPECSSSVSCARDAQCADVGEDVKVCFPRAGRCVGDGSLCSPCRSDTDCGDDGACIKGKYTSERYCAKKSATPCTQGSRGSCPETVKLATEVRAGCSSASVGAIPANFCIAVYQVGPPQCGPNQDQPCYDYGCWTPDR